MAATPHGYQYDRPKVDFQWLSDGWRLFKQEQTTWIVATLLAGILYLCASSFIEAIFDNSVHTGNTSSNGGFQFDIHTPFQMVGDLLTAIVYGVLEAGLFRMALLQIRGKRIDSVTFLAVKDVFWPIVGVSALAYIGITAGFVLCIIPGLVMAGLFLFAPIYVVADGSSPLEALKKSVNVLKTDWFTAVVYGLLTTLWIGISFLFCGIGEFATIPQVFLATAVGFCRFNGVQLSRAGISAGSPQPFSYGYHASHGNAGYQPAPANANPYDARQGDGSDAVYGHGVGAAEGPPQFKSPIPSTPLAGASSNSAQSLPAGLPDDRTICTPAGHPRAPADRHSPPSYRIPRPSMRAPRQPRRYQ